MEIEDSLEMICLVGIKFSLHSTFKKKTDHFSYKEQDNNVCFFGNNDLSLKAMLFIYHIYGFKAEYCLAVKRNCVCHI